MYIRAIAEIRRRRCIRRRGHETWNLHPVAVPGGGIKRWNKSTSSRLALDLFNRTSRLLKNHRRKSAFLCRLRAFHYRINWMVFFERLLGGAINNGRRNSARIDNKFARNVHARGLALRVRRFSRGGLGLSRKSRGRRKLPVPSPRHPSPHRSRLDRWIGWLTSTGGQFSKPSSYAAELAADNY